MVDGVASTVQWRAVWEVADRIHEDGTGQWRPGSMAVGSNVLRMVDGVSSSIQLHNKTKQPKNQRTKKPKNQNNKKPKLFQHSPWSFGFLAFWFRSSGGSSRTCSEGSNSIPRKKHEHAGGSEALKGTVCGGGEVPNVTHSGISDCTYHLHVSMSVSKVLA